MKATKADLVKLCEHLQEQKAQLERTVQAKNLEIDTLTALLKERGYALTDYVMAVSQGIDAISHSLVAVINEKKRG